MLVLYADLPGRRNRQVAADVLLLVWIATAVWCGHRVEQMVTGPARALAQGTRSLGGAGTDVAAAADKISDLPLVGDRLSAPLAAVSETSRQVSQTAQSVSQELAQVAHALGFTVAAGLTALALVVWLPPRVRFIVRATRLRQAMRQPGAGDLLALRALTTVPVRSLLQVCPDPVAGWVDRDPVVVQELVALALRGDGMTWPEHELPEAAGDGSRAPETVRR